MCFRIPGHPPPFPGIRSPSGYIYACGSSVCHQLGVCHCAGAKYFDPDMEGADVDPEPLPSPMGRHGAGQATPSAAPSGPYQVRPCWPRGMGMGWGGVRGHRCCITLLCGERRCMHAWGACGKGARGRTFPCEPRPSPTHCPVWCRGVRGGKGKRVGCARVLGIHSAVAWAAVVRACAWT
jgi:hypothetical protein